jgi:hypothetical protein
VRLVPSPPPSLGSRLLGPRIPRVLHRVALGDAAVGAGEDVTARSFAAHHDGWEVRWWRDADLAELGIGGDERARARSLGELSYLARYEALRREGGVWLDADVTVLGDLTPLLRGAAACAVLEAPGRIGTTLLAARPGHALFARAAAEVRRTLGVGPRPAVAAGPYFLTLVAEQVEDVRVLGPETVHHGDPAGAPDGAYAATPADLRWWDAVDAQQGAA